MIRSKILLIPLLSILFFASLFVSLVTAQSSKVESDWRLKVDPSLLIQLETRSDDRPIEFIVRMNEQAEVGLSPAGLLSKSAKGKYVYDQLVETANNSQAELLASLESTGAETHSFFVANAVYVKAPISVLPRIAQRSDVIHLHSNPAVQFDVLEGMSFPYLETKAPSGIEWGIDKIGAPQVWEAGFKGEGAIIGGQDTGYNWEHPALKSSYRGWNIDTNVADHNYNWHDAISADLNGNNSNVRCGYDLAMPCDDFSSTHGTHTMGTMIGLDGENQIGAAPEAKWIGCRNMEEGFGTPSTYIDCFEWFLAPTDLAGANADPSKAPHVINNSWGCPPSEGCNTSNFELMDIVIQNLRAAGIVVVTSAGNSGSSCGSVNTPAAIFEGSFAVGATDSGDQITSFSSRGPVAADGSGRMKPNVTAPGFFVRSASQQDGYASNSGTSMAAPHVAGAVGLMVSAYPPIAGNVDAIESYLEQTADYVGMGNCGGTQEFNNTFGYGRINVDQAVQAIWNFDLEKTAPETITAPFTGESVSSQTFSYTLTLTKTGPMLTFTDTIVTDVLPQGGTFISASQPVTVSGQTLTWMVGDMGPESTQKIEIVLRLSGPHSMTTTLDYAAASVSAASVPEQLSNQPSSQVIFEGNPGTFFDIDRDAPVTLRDDRIVTNAGVTTISYTMAITAPILPPIPINTTVTETLPTGASIISTSDNVIETSAGFTWAPNIASGGESATLVVVIEFVDPMDVVKGVEFPSAVVAADNVLASSTSETLLRPYQTWLSLVGQ